MPRKYRHSCLGPVSSSILVSYLWDIVCWVVERVSLMTAQEECQGCAKLRIHYQQAYARGLSQGQSTSKSEIFQLRQYISQYDTTFKEQREAFMKEMTDALQEAEDRADYWQMKYESVT